MTPMQQGMLLHTLQNPGSGMYMIQTQYVLNTAVDVEAFTQAWSQVLQRHPSLRAMFLALPDGALIQIIRKDAPPQCSTRTGSMCRSKRSPSA